MEAAALLPYYPGTIRRVFCWGFASRYYLRESSGIMILFWMKKLIARLLFPVPLVLLICGFGFCLFRINRRLGRIFVGAGFSLLILLSMPVVSRSLIGPLERKYARVELSQLLESGDDAWLIGVAGSAFGKIGGQPRFCDNFIIRLQEAGRLASALERAGRPYKIAVNICADSVPASDKQIALNAFFNSFSIPNEKVDLVTTARNSEEEVAHFLAESDHLIVVSQSFHMPRLMTLVALQNSDAAVLAAPAGCMVFNGAVSVLDFVPSSAALNFSRLAIYEALGLLELRSFR